MNYIGRLASKGYELFDYTKNVVSQIVPDENSVIGKVVGKTVEVGKGVFQGVAPHLVSMSPMYLSRMTNMRIFSGLGLLVGAVLQLQPHESWLDTAAAGVLMATNLIGTADFFGFTPLETEYRVAVDGLLLLVTAIGSSRAIYEGTNRMFSSWSAEGRSTTSKVSDFVSGAILTTLGTVGIGNSLQTSARLVSGIKTLQKLDHVQKKGVLKYRAIDSLGGEKSCKAVIIDGDPRPHSYPFSEELYKYCETRKYRVESPAQFCAALGDAKSSFGDSISVLSLQGHSNQDVFVLDYYFRGGGEEISCMKETLSSDAQIFLLGCNVATPKPNGGITLTEKISKSLPGKEITGFSAVYNPFITTSSYSNGRFQHNSHSLTSSNGFVNPISTAVTYEKSR